MGFLRIYFASNLILDIDIYYNTVLNTNKITFFTSKNSYSFIHVVKWIGNSKQTTLMY